MKKLVSLIIAAAFCIVITAVSADTDTNKAYATRADALNVLLDTTSFEADLSSLNRFSDTDGLSDEEKSIFAYCVENGLLKGYPDGTLRPLGEITRGEYAVIIERLRKDTQTPKTVFDFDINYDDSEPWCGSALKFCSKYLFMLGYGNKFGIDDNLTAEQLQIIKNRFNLKPSYDDVCVALLLQNLDDLDYDAVIQSGYDERLRFAEEDIPKQSEESKEYWKQYTTDYDLIKVSYYETEPSFFKYYCVLNTEFNCAFDSEKYAGNDDAILRLSSRKSFLRAHSTMYGVETPLFEEGNEILEKYFTWAGRTGDSLRESEEYIPEINDKISDGVKVKAFFVSAADNYLYYTQGYPGSGTKCANKGKGYEYFEYISGAPEGIENGKWYRRVVHAELMLNGETPSIRYYTQFDVKYEEAEPVPEYLLKKE